MATIHTLIDYDRQNPTAISREAYEDVGADAFAPGTFPRAFLDLEVWDAATLGNQLVLDTDYELVDIDLELSGLHYENELVYKSLRVINVTYETGFIYLTYGAVGTYSIADLHDPTGLPAAAALDGTELVAVVQSGERVKATVTEIAGEGAIAKTIKTGDYTVLATDRGTLVGNAIDNTIEFTLPDPADIEDIPLRFVNRHYGNGLMANGDCESATAPSVDTAVSASNAFFAKSADEARAGSNSYKFTVTTGGVAAAVYLMDSAATNDLHGLIAGQTYTLVMWQKIPTSNGVATGENGIELGIYSGGAWTFSYRRAVVSAGTWERLAITFTLLSAATGVVFGPHCLAAAASSEVFHIDDIQLYRHYEVTIAGPIENVASYILADEGDNLSLVSDGEKYLETDYTAHDHSGPGTDGFWHRGREGDQLVHGHAVLVYVDASTLSVAVTFLKNFLTDDYQVAIGGFIATTMDNAELRKLGALEIESKTVSGFTFTQHVDAAVVDADDTITFDYIAEGHWR